MPNIKSSKKSVKTTIKRTDRNTELSSKVKNSIKQVEKAVVNKDADTASKTLKVATKNLDSAYSKGIMKKNTRDREKARLSQKVKGMNK